MGSRMTDEKYISFPVAAITNSHKPGSLTQQEFILLLFCRSEIENQSVSRAMLLLQFQESENPFLPLPASSGISWFP